MVYINFLSGCTVYIIMYPFLPAAIEKLFSLRSGINYLRENAGELDIARTSKPSRCWLL